MEHNKSLSARIRRRNKQGFEGNGTPNWTKNTSFGDYKNDEENGKALSRKQDIARKNKLGFSIREYKIDNSGNVIYIGKKTRCMSKKYAKKQQKLN